MIMSRLLAVALSVVFVADPATSHHSFAMFDQDKKVTVSGTVKNLAWTNPHVYLDVVVTESGQATTLSFEGGTPAQMARRGWTRNAVKPGDTVTVLYNPLRTETWGGALVTVTTADGTVLGQRTATPPQ